MHTLGKISYTFQVCNGKAFSVPDQILGQAFYQLFTEPQFSEKSMCQWHILAHKNCSANSQFKTSAYSLQMNNLLGLKAVSWVLV